MNQQEHLVIMGVAGAGKSTIATQLAKRLGRPLAEADEFHSEENVAKMSSGSSLSSMDREPWLDSIRDWMDDNERAAVSTVVACSALRRVYRDRLRADSGVVVFIHLVGDKNIITERMSKRDNHFMPVSLIDSQFRDLEPLESDELGIDVDVHDSPENLIDTIVAELAVLRARVGALPAPTVASLER